MRIRIAALPLALGLRNVSDPGAVFWLPSQPAHLRAQAEPPRAPGGSKNPKMLFLSVESPPVSLRCCVRVFCERELNQDQIRNLPIDRAIRQMEVSPKKYALQILQVSIAAVIVVGECYLIAHTHAHRQTDRQTDRHTHTDTQTQKHRQTQTQTRTRTRTQTQTRTRTHTHTHTHN
jgi:hypothetical protein